MRQPRVVGTPKQVQRRSRSHQLPASRTPLIVEIPGADGYRIKPGAVAELTVGTSTRIYYVSGASVRHKTGRVTLAWRWVLRHWFGGHGWQRHLYVDESTTVMRLWPWRPSPLPRRLPA